MRATEAPNFLQSVAAYYAEGADGRPGPDEIVYVLPNKRSAMFLKKYVRECVDGVAMMPRFMTMRNFVSLFSPYPEASQRELLFVLYEAYRRTMHAHGREDAIREFDSFIFWGDMMLSDFDDIDRSLVNADDLFKNLRDIKEIQADYLDEDQKEVIRRVWGESRMTADVDRFWMHVGDAGADGEALASKFVYLWEILADVYRQYHRLLAERRLSSPGAQYRNALEAVRNMEAYDIAAGTHYVFVGFNDLSTSETLIFERLRKLGVASFFWDTAPLALSEGATVDARPKPLQRLTELVRSFPMPDGYEVPQPASVPDIRVLAVPSNIGQAKAAGRILSKWTAEGLVDTANPLNTAVVLPDQGLLLPTLLSIPEDIAAVNISMGMSYRSTTFASLFHSIISMQLRARQIHGETHFFYEDVCAVLSHPHIRQVAADEADAVLRKIDSDKMYNIPDRGLLEDAPGLSALFVPVRDLGSVADVAAYLLSLFDWLAGRLDAVADGRNVHNFVVGAIRYFREEVEKLAELSETYGVSMSERTFLHLFERIFSARGLTVNGTPLKGLQILGVLETRALDFDNVIILSMNERVFPRRQYTRTMIPNSLRSGFGLPDFDSLEWTYAYCFYRLMARAKNVTLFYDSRADGQGYGEVSRYISQMRYLMPSLNVEMSSVSYMSQACSRSGIVLKKTPEVMRQLDMFRAGGPLRLSASALKTYKACPMRFYLEYVRRMRADEELVDYTTSSQFGTAVHNAVQAVYAAHKGALVTADVIDRWLDPANGIIEGAARQSYISERYPKVENYEAFSLNFEGDMACGIIASITRANLKAERDFYCRDGASFTFVENEAKTSSVWKIDDGLEVNFYMSIDRVDRIDGSKLRFIDFKTGADETAAGGVDVLFKREQSEKDGIFQLFTYCEAYLDMVDADVDIQPVLHSMRRLSAGESLVPLTVSRKPVDSYLAYRDEFRPLLKSFIKEIFDPEVDFSQCEKSDACRFCNFRTLCGRVSNSY